MLFKKRGPNEKVREREKGVERERERGRERKRERKREIEREGGKWKSVSTTSSG